MTWKIDPFFYQADRPVAEISASFLQKHHLNFFQYGSVFADGSSTALVSNAEFLKSRVKNKRGVKSHISMEQLDKQSYFFLWNDNLPDIDTALARELDIDNGLCFVQRYPDHYNLIAFAASSKEKNTLDFYLNNLDLLKNFILEFEEKAHDLILTANEKRMYAPEEYQDTNKDKLLLKHNQLICVSHQNRIISLSVREWECLRELAMGATIKEIGKQLSLSPRTVETYLTRVKEKTGIYTRSSLIVFFHQKLKALIP